MYNLGFISDEDIFTHVKQTVEQYRFHICLDDFNKNLVDPIKLTFDSKVYGKSLEEIIESECLRQMDKSNSNYIGYFHQNLFKYLQTRGWEVPHKGFDIINPGKNIFVELKNKHNTMNAASSQKTYMKMQQKLLENDQAVCMLVEVIAKKSQNITWEITLDGKKYSNSHIKRISIDQFYKIAVGDPDAFFKLCRTLPEILDDVMLTIPRDSIRNTVQDELNIKSHDLLKSLYLLSFETYEGFRQQ